MRNFLTRRNDDCGMSIFDAFDDFFKPSFYGGANSRMKTDIKETEGGYELKIDMPDFEKSDISLTLDNGYLTVEAKKEDKKEDKYIHRERSYSCSRSYYVGDKITEEDIKAKYQNGTLSLTVPKNENKQIERKNIQID